MILASADLKVSDEAFAWLKLQRGRISDLAGDRAAWEDAYNRELCDTYHHIAPWLPRTCATILDVGSGLGGINVLISRHYGLVPDLTLLDGVDDPPVMHRHDETFSNMAAAERFLFLNGVPLGGWLSPSQATPTTVTRAYDLVVSFQAWGFHFAPSLYLPFVLARMAPDARLILDLRRRDMPWLGELLDTGLRVIGRPYESDKFERLVFARPG